MKSKHNSMCVLCAKQTLKPFSQDKTSHRSQSVRPTDEEEKDCLVVLSAVLDGEQCDLIQSMEQCHAMPHHASNRRSEVVSKMRWEEEEEEEERKLVEVEKICRRRGCC